MLNGHGDDIYQYGDIRINFSSNVYIHFCHQGLFEYLNEQLPCIGNYPEPTPSSLEQQIAQEEGLTAEEVVVTNGATEAIYLIAQAYRGSKSYIVEPTFSEYADACVLHQHQITHIKQLAELPQEAEIVWLCNPNNPTGTVTDKDELISIIRQPSATLFVIDASYAPFTTKALLSDQETCKMENAIQLHSMTKRFGVPGIRLGYATGNATLLQKIKNQRMPWSVNALAIKAGHYLLAHKEDYILDAEVLENEAKRVAKELEKTNEIEVQPTDTHLLLCRLKKGRAKELKDYLATKYGLLIRDASNFEGLDAHYFRIAVQTSEEDNELIDRINEWTAL